MLLYYAVSPVHLKNAHQLGEILGHDQIRVLVEDHAPWFTGTSFTEWAFQVVRLSEGGDLTELEDASVSALICSTLQPRKMPIRLVYKAFLENIPVVAIEESNQVALNSRRVNNYVLPYDLLMAASEEEKAGFESDGLSTGEIQVCGWPFYRGRGYAVTEAEKAAAREKLGCSEGLKIAALTLTGMGEAGECPHTREKQIRLAVDGLPDNWLLLIKPHPTEDLNKVECFLGPDDTQVRLIPGSVPVSELLDASDILLNRGVSQVCFEALVQKIPVLVLDTGIETPFHRGLSQVVVSEPEKLRELMQQDLDLDQYNSFLNQHCQITGATERVASVLADKDRLKNLSHQDRLRKRLTLKLCQVWQRVDLSHETASNVFDCEESKEARALLRLMHGNANRQDLKRLADYFNYDFYQSVVKLLWVRQLESSRQLPTAEDDEMMLNFPPRLRPVWFDEAIRGWLRLLHRKGDRSAMVELLGKLDADSIYRYNYEELISKARALSAKTSWLTSLRNRVVWDKSLPV